MINWRNPAEVLTLPIAQDWAKPFRTRVQAAQGKQVLLEASRATIEALTRKLRTRHWERTHTSKSKRDGRSDSRYYRSPHNSKFVIRISNHAFPTGAYRGAKDYLIDEQVMTDFNVLGLISMIERDEREFDAQSCRASTSPGRNAKSGRPS